MGNRVKQSAKEVVVSTPIGQMILRRTGLSEYKKLGHFHYRSGRPGPVTDVFGLYGASETTLLSKVNPVGIIVYSLPPLNSRLRNVATNNRYVIDDVRAKMILLNREIRTISRVIVHPVFRGIGLASLIVKYTLPKVGTRFVEASAVMGRFNPFFEKAGMRKYTGSVDMKCELLKSAFEYVGLDLEELLITDIAIQKISELKKSSQLFLWKQIEKYYISSRRANYTSNIRYDWKWIIPRLITILVSKPVYYFWENPEYICEGVNET